LDEPWSPPLFVELTEAEELDVFSREGLIGAYEDLRPKLTAETFLDMISSGLAVS
jgi:hypothetical protein